MGCLRILVRASGSGSGELDCRPGEPSADSRGSRRPGQPAQWLWVRTSCGAARLFGPVPWIRSARTSVRSLRWGQGVATLTLDVWAQKPVCAGAQAAPGDEAGCPVCPSPL